MPAYSTSLGCASARYLYGDSETVIKVPMGTLEADHAFEIKGGAMGTFTVAEGSPDSTEVEYKIALRSDEKALFDKTTLQYPEVADQIKSSRLLITTPFISSSSKSCMRFDITIYVPPSLKKLKIGSYATTQIKVDSDYGLEALKDLTIRLDDGDDRNMILPSTNLKAETMTLQAYQGWIVGDVSIVDTASINTRLGAAVTNVHIHPLAPTDLANPKQVVLNTSTGSGRTDIFYINDKSTVHRPILSTHNSVRSGDVYLTYKESEFSGLVSLKSSSFSATGLQPYSKPLDATLTNWTHWVRDKDGADRISVSSKGWTGLYV